MSITFKTSKIMSAIFLLIYYIVRNERETTYFVCLYRGKMLAESSIIKTSTYSIRKVDDSPLFFFPEGSALYLYRLQMDLLKSSIMDRISWLHL